MATWHTVTASSANAVRPAPTDPTLMERAMPRNLRPRSVTRPHPVDRPDSLLGRDRLARLFGEYLLLVALVAVVAGALLLEASGALGTLIHDITLTAR